MQKIMKNNNIEGVGRKKFKVMTTDSNHDLPIADRVFKTEQHDSQVVKSNQFWAGDITYVATDEGWLYLSIFLDLFTRKVVGHAMSSRMTADLVIESLNMSLRHQGLVCAHELTASMSRKGNCYDNAFVESFFRTLKVELTYRRRFKTLSEARAAIFEFIEVWYNRKRLHSSLGYQTPMSYEHQTLTAA